MPTSKTQRLTDLREQVKTLEQEVMQERLAGLHKELGFESTSHLLTELRRTIPSAGKAGAKQREQAVAKTAKRKRTVISPAHRRAVGKDLKRGKHTDGQLAKSHGLSITTIQRIKAELGLSKKQKRKKK